MDERQNRVHPPASTGQTELDAALMGMSTGIPHDVFERLREPL
jgi:hypothetical protein